MKTLTTLFLCLVLASGCGDLDLTFAPRTDVKSVVEYGSLAGVVELADGGVASGIYVQLHYLESNVLGSGSNGRSLVREASADEYGRFLMERVEARRYNINLGAYEGYRSPGHDIPVTVLPNQEAHFRYVLHPRGEPAP